GETGGGERGRKGRERMVGGLGLLKSGLFPPDVVRVLTLYPRPGVFPARIIAEGWGKPDAIGTDEQTGRPAMRYDAKGLLVIMNKSGEWAELMLFAPARPAAKPSAIASFQPRRAPETTPVDGI